MSEENFKIYSGKRCEEYYKKYNLVSAVHKIIDLEDVIKEVREEFEKLNEVDFDEHNLLVFINHLENILDMENKDE